MNKVKNLSEILLIIFFKDEKTKGTEILSDLFKIITAIGRSEMWPRSSDFWSSLLSLAPHCPQESLFFNECLSSFLYYGDQQSIFAYVWTLKRMF